MKLPLSCLLATSVCAATLNAEVITLPVTADTTLHEFFPDNNFGRNPFLQIGTTGENAEMTLARGLLKFNLTDGIPAGAVITQARLIVKVTFQPAQTGGPSTFALHRVLRNWNEGVGNTSTGSPAVAGEPTWNHQAAPSFAWELPGARGPGDIAVAPSAALSIGGRATYTFSSSEMVSDVLLWLDRPDLNFGWLLYSQAETTPWTARRFGAKEDAANAAQLQITYSVPQPELRITEIRVEGGQVILTWSGGRAPYRVERRAEVTAAPEFATDPSNETTATIPLSGQQSFYRIVGAN